MNEFWDVVSLGELLIDFTMNGKSEQENPLFEANAGGAPCNVLALLSKWGKKCAFIGKVGNDQFGKMLYNTVSELGIDVKNLVFDNECPTTLAFVHNANDGERSFSFYRNPGADMLLRIEELNESIIKQCKIFHFGTLSMTTQEIKATTIHAIRIAKESGAFISFDPNLRPPLWASLEEAKKCINYGISVCDILKISDDELIFLTGINDLDQAVKKLIATYDIKLLTISLGKDGSKVFYNGAEVFEKGFLHKTTIDTTGAGDTFCGSILYHVLEKGLDNLKESDLGNMLRISNAASSLVTTKRGALKCMPTKKEVETFLISLK